MLPAMKMQELNKCDGYVVNQSEKGIGLIPLHRTCKLPTYNIEKMTADTKDFRFMPEESIKKITIKNENWISMVAKVITITLENGVRYDWRASKKEKKIVPTYEHRLLSMLEL